MICSYQYKGIQNGPLSNNFPLCNSDTYNVLYRHNETYNLQQQVFLVQKFTKDIQGHHRRQIQLMILIGFIKHYCW